MLSGPPAIPTASPDQLLDRFVSSSARQRRSLLASIDQQAEQIRPLIPECLDRLDATGDDWVPGSLIQLLLQQDDALSQTFRQRYGGGWLAVTSAQGIDYGPLESALMALDFELADRITSEILRQLAGPAAVTRGYVYYSEVPPMAAVDLESLDRLWLTYSQGRFGFSVQLRLLRSCGERWDLLWPKLAWKLNGTWTRYPGSFTWSLAAPEGHLPLVNQLRGVRLMDALLSHPGIKNRLPA